MYFSDIQLYSLFVNSLVFIICTMKLIVLNGPNLNLLGVREPSVYGNQSFVDYLEVVRKKFPSIRIDYFQSNIEEN